jgi:predicted secreted Zn-dependent protease
MSEIEEVIRGIQYHLDPHCMVPKHVLKQWLAAITKVSNKEKEEK